MLRAMTPRTKKTAAALTGALVLASGAYALGSQTGDGPRSRARTPTPPRQGGYGSGYGPGPGTASAAARARTSPTPPSKLGVTRGQAARRAEDLRADRGGKVDDCATRSPRRSPSELGLPEAKVTAALDKLARRPQGRPQRERRRRPATCATLRRAARGQARHRPRPRSAPRFDALSPKDRRAGPPDLGDLATKLGVSEAKLRAALQTCGPARGPGGAAPACPASTAAAPATRSRRARQGARRQPGQAARRAAEASAATSKASSDKAERDAFRKPAAKELGVSEGQGEGSHRLHRPHHGRRGP